VTSPDTKTDQPPDSSKMEPESPVRVPATLLISLAGATLMLVLFAWMAREVLRGDAENFDQSVRMWVHQYASPTMTPGRDGCVPGLEVASRRSVAGSSCGRSHDAGV